MKEAVHIVKTECWRTQKDFENLELPRSEFMTQQELKFGF